MGDDEVAVIHILAVSPDRQGEGIGSEMIREAIHLAQPKGLNTPSANTAKPTLMALTRIVSL